MPRWAARRATGSAKPSWSNHGVTSASIAAMSASRVEHTARQSRRRSGWPGRPKVRSAQPLGVAVGPGGAVAVDVAVAQRQRREALAGPAMVLDQRLASSQQVPHPFLSCGGHPDRDQLTHPVQTRQAPRIALVGPDSIPAARGINAGATTSHASPRPLSWRHRP